MNLFVNAIEQAFDTYFNAKYPNSSDQYGPKYLEAYRKELNNFSNFLVAEYENSLQNEEYWDEKFRGED